MSRQAKVKAPTPAAQAHLPMLRRVRGCTLCAAHPLPHPSPRNNIWRKRNGWFEDEVLPRLRGRVRELIC
jgi:hypothetical protein